MRLRVSDLDGKGEVGRILSAVESKLSSLRLSFWNCLELIVGWEGGE